MNTDDRSLSPVLIQKRASGYLPLHQPFYYHLYQVRNGVKPVLSPLPTRSAPSPLIPKKKNRGLKTPRLMLPILLG